MGLNWIPRRGEPIINLFFLWVPQYLVTTVAVVDVGQFLLFDIHSSLGGWWLSHLWRAADFAETTCASLAEWRVLPAAACARALLEGVAAFVIEGEQLLAEWSGFKQRGVPDSRPSPSK